MKLRQYCSFDAGSHVQVQGLDEGIECQILPPALTPRMPQDPFVSTWRLEPGWAELLMIGHLTFLRTHFDLTVPPHALENLLAECAQLEVATIPEMGLKISDTPGVDGQRDLPIERKP